MKSRQTLAEFVTGEGMIAGVDLSLSERKLMVARDVLAFVRVHLQSI